MDGQPRHRCSESYPGKHLIFLRTLLSDITCVWCRKKWKPRNSYKSRNKIQQIISLCLSKQMGSFDWSCLLWAPKCLGGSQLLCAVTSVSCLCVSTGFVLFYSCYFLFSFLLLSTRPTLAPSHPSLSVTPLKWGQKEMKGGFPVGGGKDIWLLPDSKLFRSPPSLAPPP